MFAVAPHDAWAEPAADRTSAKAVAQNAVGNEFFEKRVRPLLLARCHECHGAQKHKGNLRLDSRASLLAGGDTGPAIVPFKPEESLLVDAVRYGDTYQMPPKSQLPPEEVSTLVEWVRMGAPWGAEAKAETPQPAGTFDLQARAGHWSFRPLSSVEPPAVGDSAWVKTPVDRFILAGLIAAGLQPAPKASKLALLRRVTYDLVGLPPTPAEIEAFLADDSAGAYSKVVERLLASPQYGERWGRHWLDLVRFAETCGHEFDFDLPNAYRYRDYVIRAFNEDLPFDRFVVEHVAGDLLESPRWNDEGCNESIVATGFFFTGEAKHSPVDVRQDEADRIDNQIDVSAKAFLGLTVSCARCHDHKFDPISTKDYYALTGYLQSSRFQQAFIDSPARLADSLAQLQSLRADRQKLGQESAGRALVPLAERLAESLLSPTVQGERWTKYLHDVALPSVDDPWHAWAVLSSPPVDGAASFSQRRAALVARLKEQRLAASIDEADVIADFSRPGFDAWYSTGAAFGNSPVAPLEWTMDDGAKGSAPRVFEARRCAQRSAVTQAARGHAVADLRDHQAEDFLSSLRHRRTSAVGGRRIATDPESNLRRFEIRATRTTSPLA